MLPGVLVLLLVPRQARGEADQLGKGQKVMQPKNGKYHKRFVDLEGGKQDHHGKSMEGQKYEYKPRLREGQLSQRLAFKLAQPQLKLKLKH